MKKLLLMTLLTILMTAGIAAANEQYINKKQVSVQGKSEPFTEVKIFTNSSKNPIKKVMSNEDGMWLATDIPVQEGSNEIYAKAFDQYGNESKFSKRIKIIVDTDPPRILKLETDKDRYKAKEVIKINVLASEDTVSAVVVMPDGSMLELDKTGDKNFAGEWQVDEGVANGKYRLSLSITDRAGNMAQEYSGYLHITNAIGVLEIRSPSDNHILYDPAVMITGYAPDASTVVVNNKSRSEIPEDGNFSVEYQGLLPGRNQLRVTALHDNQSIFKDLNIVRLLTFPDIQEHPFRKEIEYLATLGRMQAYANTQYFRPQMPMSREEVIATLVQDLSAAYQVIDTGSGSFADIPDSYWAANDITIAAQNQLIIGYPDRSFKPKRTITRAEMATLIVRYANIPLVETVRTAQKDISSDYWARNYIAAFMTGGLMPPTWQGSFFHPGRPVSRAEFSYILARVPLVKKKIEALLGMPVKLPLYTNTNYYQFNPVYYDRVPIGTAADGLSDIQRAQLYQQEMQVPLKDQQYTYTIDNRAPPSPPPQDNYSQQQSVQTRPTQTKNAPRSIYSVEVFPKSIAAGDELNVILFLIENIENAYLKGIDQQKVTFKRSSDHKYSAVYQIPETTQSGSYFVDIFVEEKDGRLATLRSESFVVKSLTVAIKAQATGSVEQTSAPELDKPIPLRQPQLAPQSGVIYPEEFSNAAAAQDTSYTVTRVTAKSVSDGDQQTERFTASGYLTRGRMAELLGQNNYLQKAVVNGPVADDVGGSHPHAGYIKTAIITEKIPNLKPGKFKPADVVSRAYAAVVLCKTANIDSRMAIEAPFADVAADHWAADQIYTLKMFEIISGTDFRPTDKISEQEFLTWIKKVKKL